MLPPHHPHPPYPPPTPPLFSTPRLGTFRIRDRSSPTISSLRKSALKTHSVLIVLDSETPPEMSPGKSLCKLVYHIKSVGVDVRVKSNGDIHDAIALAIKNQEAVQFKLVPLPPSRTRRSLIAGSHSELKLESLGEAAPSP